ncbi:helix-turn-helix domain-containing protein [Micromonospora sp. BRA006-A]|nr:helix-turn-helix domain-containing protein [Micromonospora sp. BRA006-A]
MELLMHPVRLRIVQAFLGGRTLTTTDLRAELSDVPPATLYRQVATLADHGVLHTVGERRAAARPSAATGLSRQPHRWTRARPGP